MLYNRLAFAVKEIGAAFEMSDAFAILRLEGERAEEALAYLSPESKILPEAVYGVKHARADGCDIMICRTGPSRCDLFIPRSVSAEFYRKLARICLPYGVRLL